VNVLRVLLLIPSFYGFALFGAAYMLYPFGSGMYEDPVPELHIICALVVLTFGLATAWFFLRYRERAQALCTAHGETKGPSWLLTTVLHVIGLVGILEYVRSLVAHFGSAADVALRLISSSVDVRTAEVTSIGTQASYLGWIAIWIGLFTEQRGWKRWFLVTMAILQFAANLLYIDRTRPMWIMFVCGLLLAVKHLNRLNDKRIAAATCATLGLFLTLFVGIGAWVGKIDVSSDGIRASADPVYFYTTSGFAYLNRILVTEEPDGTLARSLYPFWNGAARIGVVDPPPPQVNEFLSTPRPTNVGTFLEPMYRDGGILLVAVGVWAHSFGFNWIGLALLRRRTAMCLCGWAVLCFVDAIAFFTPKYTNTPTWIVVGAASVSLVLGVTTKVSSSDRVCA